MHLTKALLLLFIVSNSFFSMREKALGRKF